MHTQVAEAETIRAAVNEPPSRARVIAAIALLTALAVVVGVVGKQWPFTEQAVVTWLEQHSGSKVQIGGFRATYFPHPGCVANEVAFYKTAGGPPFITIRQLTITASYFGLPTSHIDTVRVDGVVVHLDRQTFSEALRGTILGLTVEHVIADGAQIVIPAEQKGQPPLVFRVPKVALHEVTDTGPLKFQILVHLPLPDAEVHLAGKFGPWETGRTAQAIASGSYAVHYLDLGSIAGLAGKLVASGKFEGDLQNVKVDGTLDAPNFEVRQSRHPVHLAAEYIATVHGLNGDVEIEAARAHFRRTTIFGAGVVSGKGTASGKAVTAELSAKQARIEDLLWLLVSDNPPAMSGPVVFRGKVQLPPDGDQFTKKIKLDGDFGISDAQYPNPDTQKYIDVLSARARGLAAEVQDGQKSGTDYDPGRVLTDLKGHVTMTNGVAHLRDVSFSMPGAEGSLSGTYGVLSERIDLQGHMRMEAELSKTTTGLQSMLLKVMRPFLHKSKHHVSVVAIRIGGTYDKPTYTATPIAEK